MKILFYKPAFSWPRNSGHDVHTYHMMRALGDLGVSVSLATDAASPAPALSGLSLSEEVHLSSTELPGGAPDFYRTRIEERFRHFYGISPNHICRFAAIAKRGGYDAIVVSGLPVLPMLLAMSGPVRVWYAADEWVWHHYSQFRLWHFSTWSHLPEAAIKGIYERAFRRRIDAVWLVSQSDARAMRLVTGIRDVNVLPNGVDAEFYSQRAAHEKEGSAVFWGRLDFGPNIQALEWFSERVWPRVRERRPDAQLTIMGFNPAPGVFALQRFAGITILPNVGDIRPEIARHAVVVLPFVSGGGIKNKLLEAAAMGKAIVATERALGGLNGQAPVKVARTPVEWLNALEMLWDHAETRAQLGRLSRAWVMREHSWASVAQKALNTLEDRVARQKNRS
jgi:glycosyltransferase involved in cell wall biosynthesis